MWKMRYYARRYENPVSMTMIVIMAVVFLVDFFTGQRLALLLGWEPSVAWLKSGLYYEPLTFPFVHTSIFGLLFDGLLLYWIGSSLERAWGAGKFLFFFFVTGILAGAVLIPQTAVAPVTPFFTGLAGIFVGITVAFAAMNPYLPIMFFFVTMQARWIAVIIIAVDLFGNYARYGGPLQAVESLAVVTLFSYMFATRRVQVPGFRSGGKPRGPSLKERWDRWQQRRRMRQWQRRVSKIDRPEDLFKDK